MDPVAGLYLAAAEMRASQINESARTTSGKACLKSIDPCTLSNASWITARMSRFCMVSIKQLDLGMS